MDRYTRERLESYQETIHDMAEDLRSVTTQRDALLAACREAIKELDLDGVRPAKHCQCRYCKLLTHIQSAIDEVPVSADELAKGGK